MCGGSGVLTSYRDSLAIAERLAREAEEDWGR
jgi:hypothetical protein